MGVRLTVKMKGKSATEPKTVVLDEQVITFGRDETCQVVLAQQAVSRAHARISRDGTLYFLEDLGSSFGTQVNGQKLPKGEKRLLRNGDVIAIAQFDVTFDRVADVDLEESGKTNFIARKVVKDVMKGLAAGGQNAYFRVMNGSNEGQRIEIVDAQEYIFGRDKEEADVVLNDDLVSRKHVKVRRGWSGTQVEDLGSRNGIKLNKKRTRKAQLKDRDELEIGGVRLLFIDPTEVREDELVAREPEVPSEEGTVAVKDEPAPEPAPQPEPEPVADPPPSTEAEASPPAPDSDSDSEEPAAESPEVEPSVIEGPAKRFDLKNRQTLITLAVVGVAVLLAVILLVLLLVGA